MEKEPTVIKSKETVMAEGHNGKRGGCDDYKKSSDRRYMESNNLL